jgi:hypothetical protein
MSTIDLTSSYKQSAVGHVGKKWVRTEAAGA